VTIVKIWVLVNMLVLYLMLPANAQVLDPIAAKAMFGDIANDRNNALNAKSVCVSDAALAAAQAARDAKFAQDEIFWWEWWADHKDDWKNKK
jgi:hypothetical protein